MLKCDISREYSKVQMEQTLAKVEDLMKVLTQLTSHIRAAQQSEPAHAKFTWLHTDDPAELAAAQDFMSKHNITITHFKTTELMDKVKTRLDEEDLILLDIYRHYVVM